MAAIVGAVLIGLLARVIGVAWSLWRAGSSKDVRRTTAVLRDLLEVVNARGGAETDLFFEPEPRRAEQRLEQLIVRLHDRELQRRCEALLINYRRTFADAPP